MERVSGPKEEILIE